MPRYAIYAAPEAISPLWYFGSGVIGYDAASGRDVSFIETAGLSVDRWSAMTEDPRRYGFHATLKAPFELAPSSSETALLADVEALAATLSPVTLSGLVVRSIGRFIALVPTEPSATLQSLAAITVERLDHLRAPLSAADRARRLRSPLTPRQIEYLDRFGYPYVLDEFRFHMTLTGPISDDAERTRISEVLGATYVQVVSSGPMTIDALAVYRQPDRDARFHIIARCPLKAPAATGAHP